MAVRSHDDLAFENIAPGHYFVMGETMYLDRLQQVLSMRHSSMRWRPGFLVPGGS